ncbi:hypothetical protein K402DRAFT_328588 [Aulographum hederae CBS 113979]|uniref:Uncharacterized protein n=1 Tax=Aulographum hederae CBS 113979 TaxID=1176131 RepID=A0A6G1H6F4_9PEZI|nr:hypothetical protein K402DRAFT_328588 [Aulographum hederae CBS 113979]
MPLLSKTSIAALRRLFVISFPNATTPVFKKPLSLHSTRPMTGFLRDGYCKVPEGDFGNHSVAAMVTNEFLEFSASKGNDLRSIGLTGGCKWCLCANRWKEALDAAKGDQSQKGKLVPQVFLNATNEAALQSLDMNDLKKFAADAEV